MDGADCGGVTGGGRHIPGYLWSAAGEAAGGELGERKAIVLGYLGGVVGYWMFGFTKTGLLLFLGIPALNLMSVAWPSEQPIMSRSTPPHEQGLL
jgi:DHA1 family tetracycline resistance protein-like MFS transporter